MSRAGDLIARVAQHERVTVFSFDFDRDNVVDSNGRKLPREVQTDMKRAKKVELRGNRNDLMGYIDRSPVFTAGGYYDEDEDHFVVDSYYSKNLMSSNGAKFVKNTVNADKFHA